MIRLGITAKGWVHDYEYQFDSAIYYYNSAYQFSLKNQDKKGIATSLFNIGVTFYYQGNLDSAIYYYLATEPFFSEIDDKGNLSRLYNNMGRIYEKTKKYSLALEVSRQSIDIKKEEGNVKGLLNSYTNMSSIFQQMEQYDSALVYSNRCIVLAKEVGDLSAYKAELVNLGIIYKNLALLNESIAAYKEAESLITDNDDPYFFLQVYLNLGVFYFASGDLVKTYLYLQKMNGQLLEEEYLETALHYYELDYKYQKRMGNYQASAESMESYLALKEKFLNQKTLEKTTELEQLYEKEKRESEIVRLNLASENQKAQIATRNNQRNISIFSTVIVLLLAFFLLYRYRTKAMTSRLLEEKNTKISATLEERETLLKEIHHRVKNNLQIISSLLNLQADSLQDAAALGAVREGQFRVRSMALIHEKLYQETDLRGVDVMEYMESLVAELFSAFGVDEEKVKYQLNTNSIKMDIDTLIPLGLILTELITNCLKYAFKTTNEGLLQIQMQEKNGKLMVYVKDNGIGMSHIDLEASNSFGWKMIRSLSRKLKAEIEVSNEAGTTVQMSLSRYKLVI